MIVFFAQIHQAQQRHCRKGAFFDFGFWSKRPQHYKAKGITTTPPEELTDVRVVGLSGCGACGYLIEQYKDIDGVPHRKAEEFNSKLGLAHDWQPIIEDE